MTYVLVHDVGDGGWGYQGPRHPPDRLEAPSRPTRRTDPATALLGFPPRSRGWGPEAVEGAVAPVTAGDEERPQPTLLVAWSAKADHPPSPAAADWNIGTGKWTAVR